MPDGVRRCCACRLPHNRARSHHALRPVDHVGERGLQNAMTSSGERTSAENESPNAELPRREFAAGLPPLRRGGATDAIHQCPRADLSVAKGGFKFSLASLPAKNKLLKSFETKLLSGVEYMNGIL